MAEELHDPPSRVRVVSEKVVGGALEIIWRLKVEGPEHVPPTGGVIIAANHNSFWDGPALVTATCPARYLRFLTKIEMFRMPVLGWYMGAIGNIPLDRDNADIQALRSAVAVLERGGTVGVFPEGTRSKTGLPGRAKAGLGFLARASGAWVVPARLYNTRHWMRLAPLKVRFGPPMKFESRPGGGRKECLEFSQMVLDRIFAL